MPSGNHVGNAQVILQQIPEKGAGLPNQGIMQQDILAAIMDGLEIFREKVTIRSGGVYKDESALGSLIVTPVA